MVCVHTTLTAESQYTVTAHRPGGGLLGPAGREGRSGGLASVRPAASFRRPALSPGSVLRVGVAASTRLPLTTFCLMRTPPPLLPRPSRWLTGASGVVTPNQRLPSRDACLASARVLIRIRAGPGRATVDCLPARNQHRISLMRRWCEGGEKARKAGNWTALAHACGARGARESRVQSHQCRAPGPAFSNAGPRAHSSGPKPETTALALPWPAGFPRACPGFA